MSAFLASIGLAEVAAGTMILALNAYALTGGADFGGGLWDLLASGPRRAEQRALVAHAIGPIWEANHVWLIVVVVVLFTGFPATFAALGTVLHVPLALMLVGIVLRGSAFVFRSYGAADDAGQRRWGRVFAIASTLTPLLLGVVVGTIASGNAGRAVRRVAAVGAITPFADVYLSPWLAPFPLVVGAMALALFAFLAAVYLALAAGEAALRDDFRRRALGAAVAVFVTAAAALAIAARHAPHVVERLLGSPLALVLQLAVAASALTGIAALWTRRWHLARVA
ncbi:MAG: cytochrome d ubiquinol oxidase subunit II, partial [Gemmatimonadaceae bacterium]|nr:cytochrome d ubiquinol oxidase subunit II [Gemmatimonadaceae bacterium]